MAMPITNSLGVKLGMTSEHHSGASYFQSQPISRPIQSQYGTQYGSLGRSRPRSGASDSHSQQQTLSKDLHVVYGYGTSKSQKHSKYVSFFAIINESWFIFLQHLFIKTSISLATHVTRTTTVGRIGQSSPAPSTVQSTLQLNVLVRPESARLPPTNIASSSHTKMSAQVRHSE